MFFEPSALFRDFNFFRGGGRSIWVSAQIRELRYFQDNKDYSIINKDNEEILEISDKECIEEQNNENNEIQPKIKENNELYEYMNKDFKIIEELFEES